MPKRIVCYSRKRGVWVSYLRPSRAEAIRHAAATHGDSFDPADRTKIVGCLPLVWQRGAGEFASDGEAIDAA